MSPQSRQQRRQPDFSRSFASLCLSPPPLCNDVAALCGQRRFVEKGEGETTGEREGDDGLVLMGHEGEAGALVLGVKREKGVECVCVCVCVCVSELKSGNRGERERERERQREREECDALFSLYLSDSPSVPLLTLNVDLGIGIFCHCGRSDGHRTHRGGTDRERERRVWKTSDKRERDEES